MVDLKVERIKRLHRELWHWLMMNPKCSKLDWPRWSINGGPVSGVENNCFLCQAALKEAGFREELMCAKCMGNWPENFDGVAICCGPGGLWTRWYDYREPLIARAFLSRHIRDVV